MDNLIFIGLAIWLTVITVFLIRMVGRYNRLTQGIKKKEIRELLEKTYAELVKQEKETEALRTILQNLETQGERHLQRVGFVRFNPFTDTGGDQSFCLAVLDRHDNGVVISSLHSREQTRMYAKEIKEGKAEGHALSKEENEALKRAQGK